MGTYHGGMLRHCVQLARVHGWFGREPGFELEKVVNVCHRASGIVEQWCGLWLRVERTWGREAMPQVT